MKDYNLIKKSIRSIFMAEFDDNDRLDNEEEPQEVNKKKILLFLVPALIAIGIAVGLYHTFGSSFNDVQGLPYDVLEQDGKEGKQSTIFYDLPEISAPLQNAAGGNDIVRFKISLELSGKEDVKKVEVLLPRFYDIILSHTRELRSEEVSGAEGLYWLKEELLYRINLVSSPVKITNINFKSFEIQKK